MRTLGVTDLLAGSPDWAYALAAVWTQLGDAWALCGLTVALAIVARRRSIFKNSVVDPIVVLAVVIGAYGLTVGLKTLIGAPRPPIPARTIEWVGPAGVLLEWFAHADGVGFPSGHALVSTAAYGTIARRWRDAPRRPSAVLVAMLVGSIGLSRLLLGVHYLVDVLAGVAIGGLVLAVTARARDRTVVLGGTLTGGLFGLLGGQILLFVTAIGAGAWWVAASRRETHSR
ncbi:MAG: phosphatase PAP2 family protein [Halococcoides sp.]